jgi:hypothetical protein
MHRHFADSRGPVKQLHATRLRSSRPAPQNDHRRGIGLLRPISENVATVHIDYTLSQSLILALASLLTPRPPCRQRIANPGASSQAYRPPPQLDLPHFLIRSMRSPLRYSISRCACHLRSASWQRHLRPGCDLQRPGSGPSLRPGCDLGSGPGASRLRPGCVPAAAPAAPGSDLQRPCCDLASAHAAAIPLLCWPSANSRAVYTACRRPTAGYWPSNIGKTAPASQAKVARALVPGIKHRQCEQCGPRSCRPP